MQLILQRSTRQTRPYPFAYGLPLFAIVRGLDANGIALLGHAFVVSHQTLQPDLGSLYSTCTAPIVLQPGGVSHEDVARERSTIDGPFGLATRKDTCGGGDGEQRRFFIADNPIGDEMRRVVIVARRGSPCGTKPSDIWQEAGIFAGIKIG